MQWDLRYYTQNQVNDEVRYHLSGKAQYETKLLTVLVDKRQQNVSSGMYIPRCGNKFPRCQCGKLGANPVCLVFPDETAFGAALLSADQATPKPPPPKKKKTDTPATASSSSSSTSTKRPGMHGRFFSTPLPAQCSWSKKLSLSLSLADCIEPASGAKRGVMPSRYRGEKGTKLSQVRKSKKVLTTGLKNGLIAYYVEQYLFLNGHMETGEVGTRCS